MATSVCNYTTGGGKDQIYDFPKLTATISQLQYEFENFKYTVYRCAAKFVALQKVFFTSNIPYKLVLAVMDRHGISDGDVNLMILPFQLTSLIHDVYYACEKLGHFSKLTSYSLETSTAILSNFFWNIYDPHRRHSISLLEIKITFLLLCKLYASDQLITEFYNLLYHKKTKCVPKLNFEYFVNILSKIFSYIGEGTAYGSQNLPLVMDQCYARCHNLSGLTDYQFHCLWTTTQTRFLIYANLIALIKRIEDTEKLIHFNICASCHIDKITGIRFKCQSCKDLSLCMKCFATGYSNNKHVVTHKMYEVFAEDLPTKKFSHYFAKLCTVFFCNSKKLNEEESKGFCNANETVANNDTELVTIATHRSSTASTVSVKAAAEKAVIKSKQTQSPSNERIQGSNIHKIDSSLSCLTTTATNALNVSGKLQIIIDKLLYQNEKLELQLKYVQTSTQDEISRFLSEHQQFLVDIITEMRNFSQNSSATMASYPASSTPNRSNFIKTPTTGLDNFSAVLNPKSNTVAINYPHQVLNTPKDNLTHSINGADINRSYLDANKSDYSINDLSLWFNQRRLSSSSMPPSLTLPTPHLGVLTEVPSQDELSYHDKNNDDILITHSRGTEMTNFKLLLNKVKEIVEDSYSDNTELSEATQNLENVLDSIIKTEEGRRRSLN